MLIICKSFGIMKITPLLTQILNVIIQNPNPNNKNIFFYFLSELFLLICVDIAK